MARLNRFLIQFFFPVRLQRALLFSHHWFVRKIHPYYHMQQETFHLDGQFFADQKNWCSLHFISFSMETRTSRSWHLNKSHFLKRAIGMSFANEQTLKNVANGHCALYAFINHWQMLNRYVFIVFRQTTESGRHSKKCGTVQRFTIVCV